MSAYPMKITSQSFNHKGGTKSYHLMIIETADGRAVFVNRWGKTGQFGDLQASTPGMTPQTAWKLYEKKEREKVRGGYEPVGMQNTKEVAETMGLAAGLGTVMFNKIGKEAINYLDPSISTAGMRDAEAPGYDEEGRRLDTARRADISKHLAQQKAEEAEQIKQAYEANELWGAF